MAIPGYNQEQIVERTLAFEPDEPTVARLSIIADVVPEATTLIESDAERPPGALGPSIELYALEDVEGLEVLGLECPYSPGALPPGASPTDVALAIETADGYEMLESEVDLEEVTVSATMTDRPSGTVVVPVTTYDRTMSDDDSPRQ